MTPNLDGPGRRARAIGGGVCLLIGSGVLAAGWWAPSWGRRIGVGLMALGVFMVFEAARGWCVLRACGIRTRL